MLIALLLVSHQTHRLKGQVKHQKCESIQLPSNPSTIRTTKPICIYFSITLLLLIFGLGYSMQQIAPLQYTLHLAFFGTLYVSCDKTDKQGIAVVFSIVIYSIQRTRNEVHFYAKTPSILDHYQKGFFGSSSNRCWIYCLSLSLDLLSLSSFKYSLGDSPPM